MITTGGALFLVVLIILLVGALPAWPYSRKWGYTPGGVFAAFLIIVLGYL